MRIRFFFVALFAVSCAHTQSSRTPSSHAGPSSCSEALRAVTGQQTVGEVLLSKAEAGRRLALANSITTAEDLNAVFEGLTGLVPGKHDWDFTNLSTQILKDHSIEEIRAVFRPLVFSHAVDRKNFVRDLYYGFERRDIADPFARLESYSHGIDSKQYEQWHRLYDQITSSETFTDFLKRVQKLQSMDLRKNMDDGEVARLLVVRLIELEDPSLVGQLLERYRSLDSLTRAYFLSNLFDLRYVEETQSMNVVLRGKDGPESVRASNHIQSMLKKEKAEWEKDAYFRFKTNYVHQIPEHDDKDKAWDIGKQIIIDFIRQPQRSGRTKSLNLNNDLQDTIEVMIERYRGRVDKEFDASLNSVLTESPVYSGRSSEVFKSERITYLKLELQMYRRSLNTPNNELITDLRNTIGYLNDQWTGEKGVVGMILDDLLLATDAPPPIIEALLVEFFKRQPELIEIYAPRAGFIEWAHSRGFKTPSIY